MTFADIELDKQYLITYVFSNDITTISKICNIDIDNLLNKLNTINKLNKYMIKNDEFTRDIYYSQIRDKNNKYEKIYTNEYKFINNYNSINSVKLSHTFYLINKEEILYDNLTFPNLNKYHHTTNIIQHIIKIENIILIIENNKIFIEFKNPNIDLLCDIIQIIDQIIN
jgi:hypothetical protein